MPKRLPMPGSIPGANAHNILLHIDHGPRDETDRVLQIAREGLAAARYARRELLSVQEVMPEASQLIVGALFDRAAERKIFDPAFREAAEQLVQDIKSWRIAEESRVKITAHLECALDALETVSDHAAASLAVQSFKTSQGQI